jgi:hypothetical protein
MRILSSMVLAFTVAAGAPALASPPVMNIDPAAESEFILETKVLSVETRPPATAEGTETTEIRCTVTKIVKAKSAVKTTIRVGTRLALVGTCQRHAKPMDVQMAGYPSDRCDAGAWTAPYWMKEQKKDQPLTLYLKHAVPEGAKAPVAGKLETVSDRRPGPSPALVTLVPAAAAKK